MALLGGIEKWKVLNRARELGAAGLDLLFPPLCLGCRIEVDAHQSLCPTCWGQMVFMGGSECLQCGFPFEVDLGSDTICAPCLVRPPAFDHARAVFRYDNGSRRLVLSFKHGDRLEGAEAFSRWMGQSLRSKLPGISVTDIDWVVPVPLHRFRLFKRRYNQAAILAHGVARELGRCCAPDLLMRTRPTPSQGGLNRDERRKNVRNAFAVRPSWHDQVTDRRILLVDDVITTGATLDACAQILKRAGAAQVLVVALGRVVRGMS